MSKDKQWVGINLQWDGEYIHVKSSDMTVRQLVNLFYGALQEIPFCREAMLLALEKTPNNGEENSKKSDSQGA